MRFTYYATTISFIAAVWAVPVNITASSNSGLHARKSAVFSNSAKAKKYLGTLAPPKPQSPTAIHRSTIAVSLMSAEEYLEMTSGTGGVAIEDKPCSPADLVSVKDKITTLLDLAIKAPGLRVKPHEPPAISFEGNCVAQWFPVFAAFAFNVEDGMGGLCEKEWCFGQISLKSGHGYLSSLTDGFYDTRNADDEKQVEALIAKHGDHS